MTFSTLAFLFALTFIFIVLAAYGIFWSVKSGQFDDLEGPAQRILMDDDDPMIPFNRLKAAEKKPKMSEINKETV